MISGETSKGVRGAGQGKKLGKRAGSEVWPQPVSMGGLDSESPQRSCPAYKQKGWVPAHVAGHWLWTARWDGACGCFQAEQFPSAKGRPSGEVQV